MNHWTGIITIALGGLTVGCSSSFQASAPGANPSERYVFGIKQGLFNAGEAIWLCPLAGRGQEPAECVEVDIVED